MENLERIIAKIVEEANEKAKFVLDDAEHKSNEILLKAKNKIEISKKELEKEYELIGKAKLDRIKSSTALKSRNIILEAKQESLKHIFEILNNMILEISFDDMKQYIHKILANRTLLENEKLIIASKYEGIDLGLEYELSDKINTGFMIEKNGIYENYTLEALINFNKDDIETKIQEQIFS